MANQKLKPRAIAIHNPLSIKAALTLWPFSFFPNKLKSTINSTTIATEKPIQSQLGATDI